VVKGFPFGTRFLGPVENSNPFHRAGQHVEEVFRRERPEQVNGDKSYFLTQGNQVVDGFTNGFRHRSHGYDDIFSIGSPVINKGVVFPSGEFVNLIHISFHDIGNGIKEAICRLLGLEENVRILGSTAGYRVFGIQGTATEGFDGLHIHQGEHLFGGNHVDFLDFV